MFDRTKETPVTGEVQIWAVPKTQHMMECEREEGNPHPVPFEFEIRTERSWRDGAVKLHTVKITVTCPGGIDLLQSALNTLREEKEEERRKFERRMSELDQQIASLAMLEYIPHED